MRARRASRTTGDVERIVSETAAAWTRRNSDGLRAGEAAVLSVPSKKDVDRGRMNARARNDVGTHVKTGNEKCASVAGRWATRSVPS